VIAAWPEQCRACGQALAVIGYEQNGRMDGFGEGWENVQKLLIQAAACQSPLLMRSVYGAGKPKAAHDRVRRLFCDSPLHKSLTNLLAATILTLRLSHAKPKHNQPSLMSPRRPKSGRLDTGCYKVKLSE